MKENSIIKNEHLKILVTALVFGGVWGFLEATLGSLLHLPAFEDAGMFLGSTAVMLPIAYFLMALAYKQSGKSRTIIYVGLIAAAIKLFAFVIPGQKTMKIINPAVSIVIESLVTAGVVALMKPDKVLSLKSLGVVAISNIVWTSVFLAYNATLAATTTLKIKFFPVQDGVMSMNWERIGGFLTSCNFIGFLYTTVIGAIAFGIVALVNKYGKPVSEEKLEVTAFHHIAAPIVAAVIPALAITATILLTAFPA